jgi:hypothetical protein
MWCAIRLLPVAYFLSTTFLSADPTLQEAFDDTNLVWTTDGAAVWSGQTSITHDGVDAGQSGLVGNDLESWAQTTVTGPGTFTFWWKVSCESGYDCLEFSLDETILMQITGEIDWKAETIEIEDGTHVLKWNYVKDIGDSGGQDRGWVDQISFQQPTPSAPKITSEPASQTVGASVDASFSVMATGFPAPQYQWRFNGATLAYATNRTLLLLNVATSNAGDYTVVVTNSFGAATSDVAHLTVILLSEALDGAGLIWSGGGANPWYAEVAVAHDGVDAAESGAIGASQETWVETTAVGPGTLSFWWKASSESNAYGFGGDPLEFVVDSLVWSNIMGEVSWQHLVYSLPAGPHALRWRYRKDSSVDAGQDRAWLDQVSYVYVPPLPFTLGAPASGTNSFSLTLLGETGRFYSIRATTNLTVWEEVTNFLSVAATNRLTFPQGQDNQRRFYRGVAQ